MGYWKLLSFGSRPIVVAIDGPAGAGKSTIARRVAKRLGFTYIDTGAMYRAVALWAQELDIPLEDHYRLEQLARQAHIGLDGETVVLNNRDVTQAIRQPQVSEAASKAAACPGVRTAMREEQRRIAEGQSCVMEGRDIGTVVFPDARVKIFLDADPQERARRRAVDLGGSVSVETVAQDIAQRDHRDRTRAEAPLTQAPDAEYVDSSSLSPEEVEEAILRIVRQRTSN